MLVGPLSVAARAGTTPVSPLFAGKLIGSLSAAVMGVAATLPLLGSSCSHYGSWDWNRRCPAPWKCIGNQAEVVDHDPSFKHPQTVGPGLQAHPVFISLCPQMWLPLTLVPLGCYCAANLFFVVVVVVVVVSPHASSPISLLSLISKTWVLVSNPCLHQQVVLSVWEVQSSSTGYDCFHFNCFKLTAVFSSKTLKVPPLSQLISPLPRYRNFSSFPAPS